MAKIVWKYRIGGQRYRKSKRNSKGKLLYANNIVRRETHQRYTINVNRDMNPPIMLPQVAACA